MNGLRVDVARAAIGRRGGTRLVERAIREQCFPTLRSLGFLDRTASRWRDHTVRTLTIRHRVGLVDEALGDVPWLLLKGEPLSELLFSDPYARKVSDIDVLVAAHRVDSTVKHLESLGLGLANDLGVREAAYNQVALIEPSTRVVVEVHWDVAFPQVPTPGVEHFFDRSVPTTVGDAEVRVPCPADVFLLLVYHFQQHAGFLKGALELAAWLDRFGDEFADEIDEIAAPLGIRGLIQWPLHTLARLTGQPVPMLRDDVGFWVDAWADATADRLRGVLGRPPRHDSQARDFLAAALSNLMLDGPDRYARTAYPFLLGPHRLGRLVGRLLDNSEL